MKLHLKSKALRTFEYSASYPRAKGEILPLKSGYATVKVDPERKTLQIMNDIVYTQNLDTENHEELSDLY